MWKQENEREGMEAGLSQAQPEAPGKAFDVIVRLH